MIHCLTKKVRLRYTGHDGGTEYDMEEGSKNTVGTEITLFLNEESVQFSNEYRVREVIEKYCSFMPVEIFLSKENAEQEYETILEEELRDDDVIVERIHEEAKMEEKENENGEKEMVEVSPAVDKVKINKRPVSLSDTTPLWTKHPNECSEEEYRILPQSVYGLQRAIVLDPSEYGLSIQFERYFVFPENQHRV